MMEFSLISTHESSIYNLDKSQSYMQSYEVDSQFSEYSNIIEYRSNSKIIEICTEFREITKKCSADNNYLNMLSSYLGNLSEFLDCTVKNMSLLSKHNDCDLLQISSLIHNEIKTWRLMYLLYEDRFSFGATEPKLLTSRFSELELIRDLYDNHTLLREAQIVVDWMEYFAKEKLDKNADFLLGSHGKAWEHTKHTIRKGNMFMLSGNNFLNELDPDAPLRGKLNLTDQDKNDENEYLLFLFHCLQSGDSEKAHALCQNHDELWRGLSLEGWRPFHNPLFKDDDMNSTDVVGNPNRDLFRSVCKQLSDDYKLNKYERAIYGIFCGNIDALTPVVKDWDGLLWAYFKVYIENVVEDHLRMYTINGSFGTQSLFGDGDIDIDSLLGGSNSGDKSKETLTHFTCEQIFHDIAAKLVYNPIDVIKTDVRPGSKLQGSYYQSIFEMVQQFIILSDIEGLLHYIELALSKLPQKKSSADKLVLRFLAHVVIFMFSIFDDLKVDVYHRVLEHYIESLIDERSLANISFYVSKLSTDLQIKWYSRCMIGVTELSEKRRCIVDGLESDLPIVDISRLVVQSMRLRPDVADARTRHLPGHCRDQPGIVTDSDRAKISALDWLTILPQQYADLVRQTNALCRVFLDNDKLSAAKIVLSKTPKEIITHLQNNRTDVTEPRWLASAIYENQCLKAFLAAYDAFGDWSNHLSSNKPTGKDFNIHEDLNKLSFHEKQMLQKEFEEYSLAMKQWEKIATYNANKVLELFMGTLKMGARGWMSEIGREVDWEDGSDVRVGDEENRRNAGKDNDTWWNRKEQIAGLRARNIVGVAFLLLQVLEKSEMKEKCFVVTDLLADETLGLHEHFSTAQLQKVLQQVRQCSLQLMSDGCDPLGGQSV